MRGDRRAEKGDGAHGALRNGEWGCTEMMFL